MDKKEKLLIFFGGGLMSLVFSATSPTIHFYFVSAVSSRTLAIADIVMTVVAAMVNMSIPSDKMKRYYRQHFTGIVMVDILSFFIITFISMDYPDIRMIALGFFRATTITLWTMIMNNAIRRLVSGDNLTTLDAQKASIELWCSVVGGVIAIFFSEIIPVEIAILIQAITNMIMGITDLIAFSSLKKKAYKEDEGKIEHD